MSRTLRPLPGFLARPLIFRARCDAVAAASSLVSLGIAIPPAASVSAEPRQAYIWSSAALDSRMNSRLLSSRRRKMQDRPSNPDERAPATALSQDSETWLAILNQMPVAVVVAEVPSGKLLWRNDKA